MNNESSMLKRESHAAEKLQQRGYVAPLVDIFENGDELLLVADVPGVSNDDLSIQFEKGQLTLEARRNDAFEGTALAAEYRPFDFRRTFVIPQGIDAAKISAELNSGVLRVHLPKAAQLKPRQIHVKTG